VGDSVVGLFSFGAFVQYVGDKDFTYLDHDKRELYIKIVSILLLIAIIISLIFFIVMRCKLVEK